MDKTCHRLGYPQLLVGLFCLCLLSVTAKAHDVEALSRAIENTRDAVVKIEVSKPSSSEPTKDIELDQVNESFKNNFAEIFALGKNVRNIGSGLILDNTGLIVSSAHLFRDARKIKVTLASGKSTSASLLGVDGSTDIALLKIILKQSIMVPQSANLDSARVGQGVYAIGAPFGFPGSVTAGVISAIRDQSGVFHKNAVIQTDVAVNPGSSGGPLFNYQGEVLGITTEIMSTNGGFQGVSFAVPMDSVLRVVERLKRKAQDDESD